MVLTAMIHGQQKHFDLSQGYDISIPITEQNPTNAFHLPLASFTAFEGGDFVGSVERGGPVRCDIVQLAPHGNGTHTECVGHIAGKGYTLVQSLVNQLHVAQLVTVVLDKETNAVTLDALSSAWDPIGCDALVIRTLPNQPEKKARMWSGNNPPHVEPDAMKLIVVNQVQHLLIDLPSVDPEEDGGALVSHHVFWQYPDHPRAKATISELVFIGNDITDGVYLLDLNAAGFDGDAAPSRPFLFPEMKIRDESETLSD